MLVYQKLVFSKRNSQVIPYAQPLKSVNLMEAIKFVMWAMLEEHLLNHTPLRFQDKWHHP
jgi:hypothetical protein